MAVVTPLAGLRYDPARVGGLRDVIAPPYDVISAAQQAALYDRSPYNVVRLILARDADRGAAAAATLREWVSSGILRRDPEPALYPYAQTFRLADGSVRTREGIICRLRLEEFASGVVRPHERTLAGPKADRLAVLRATGAHLSPIFGLYTRPGMALRDLLGGATDAPPVVDVTEDGGDTHRLWRVTDAAAIVRLQETLGPESVIIADGHHRYETALAYRGERSGAGGSASVLAFLAETEQEGLVVLPTHRLVRGPLSLTPAALEAGLAAEFDVEHVPQRPRAAGEIDCLLPDRRLRLRPRPAARARLAHLPSALRGLDVALLHAAILEPLLRVTVDALEFTHDDAEAGAAVEVGRAAAAFRVNPPSLAEVRAVCMAGELMPEKSTYFYPKLASGLVFDLVGPPWM
jgi:uncharacterized protein (DUF1015 family)